MRLSLSRRLFTWDAESLIINVLILENTHTRSAFDITPWNFVASRFLLHKLDLRCSTTISKLCGGVVVFQFIKFIEWNHGYELFILLHKYHFLKSLLVSCTTFSLVFNIHYSQVWHVYLMPFLILLSL